MDGIHWLLLNEPGQDTIPVMWPRIKLSLAIWLGSACCYFTVYCYCVTCALLTHSLLSQKCTMCVCVFVALTVSSLQTVNCYQHEVWSASSTQTSGVKRDKLRMTWT